MEEENTGPFRRTSSRTRKMATKMVAALASNDNRTQAAIARLEALENDNAGTEVVDTNGDDDASLDDEDQGFGPLISSFSELGLWKKEPRRRYQQQLGLLQDIS